MVQKEDVVGVDLMPGYIRIAQLDQQKGRWILTRVGYKYVEGDGDDLGLDDIRNHPENYISKLRQAVETNKITTTNAAVSIPVSSAIIRVIPLPSMTDEELREAEDTESLWENVVQLSDSLDEYSIFHQVIKRHTHENTMDLLFVASKLDDIEHYMNIVRQAGLNPVIVDVRCFSLRNALNLKKDLSIKEPVALLEFGAFENYLLILYENAPFIAEIYVSDQDKDKYLHMSSTSSVEDETKKVFDRAAMQVSQVLSTYEAKYKVQIPKIFVTSTMPSTSDALDYLQEGLPNVVLEEFNPVSDIRVPENIKKKIDAEPNVSMFAPVLGLATRKLDVFGYYQYMTGVNNINLLPHRDQVRAREKTKYFAKWGLVLGVVLLLTAGSWSFFDSYKETNSVEEQLSDYYALVADRDTKQLKLDELTQAVEDYSGLLEASKNIQSNQQFQYDILMHINDSIIDGIALESLSYSDGVVDIIGKSVSDQNIITFNQQLGASTLVERASIKRMWKVKEDGVSVKSFSLRILLGSDTQSDGGEKKE